jgi:5-methylcytosine-specific restriction endonuclease McrA
MSHYEGGRLVTDEELKTRHEDRQKMRLEIISRDGYKCHWCQEKLNRQNETIDHIIPLSKKGEQWIRENCVVACKACNSFRGNMNANRFKKFISRIVRSWAAKNYWKKDTST